jgi:hypothetical protein
MDILLHSALEWEYRGRKVQQASVVYVALEGRNGIPARAEAAKAHLQIERMRKVSAARDIAEDKFVRTLQGKPKVPVQIWYLADASDTWVFAIRLRNALTKAGWQ